MTDYLRSIVSAIGPDVADLLEGGVLILFGDGAPPELAEVSVLHKVTFAGAEAPKPGVRLALGDLEAEITGIGPLAWAKICDIGHVVISFNGKDNPDRPGELSAERVEPEALLAALTPGASLRIFQG